MKSGSSKHTAKREREPELEGEEPVDHRFNHARFLAWSRARLARLRAGFRLRPTTTLSAAEDNGESTVVRVGSLETDAPGDAVLYVDRERITL